MRSRNLLLGAVVATALAVAPAMGAVAAEAENPLVRDGSFDYNDRAYTITVTPASGSRTVSRDSYRVASSYDVTVAPDTGSGARAVYTGRLSYVRAAYLHTKLIGFESALEGGLDVHRDYGLSTYLRKTTGFSAEYDRARLDALVANYRKGELRGDVTSTAQRVRTYLAEHGSLAGIQDEQDVVVKTEGLFGYSGDAVSVRLFVDPADASAKTFEVVGLEKPDLYQSVHDSATGAVRSGPIDTVSNLD